MDLVVGLVHVSDCRRLRRATEMDITMIGLQNAGKTSLLRVLAVSSSLYARVRCSRTAI
jgi:GTPase SAR1 family protein